MTIRGPETWGAGRLTIPGDVVVSGEGARNIVFKAKPPGPTITSPTITDVVEPLWPTTPGETVVDGAVEWEAVEAPYIQWTATKLMVSGAIQPTWPTTEGATVVDNSMAWECVSKRVLDVNCPHTTVVVIAASKVFAADGDIIRFCATTNPLDWSTENDAGHLPSGLQQGNANDMAVLGVYRGNLVAWNANCFQMWQVDPDPAQMALLDQMEGIGSTSPRAAQAVADELLYLSQQGVRSVGQSASSQSLQSDDIGKPVDELIGALSGTPVATYYPGAGQYWIAFGSTALVCTMSGKVRGWSRYTFPFAIEAFAQLGDDLYIRAGDAIYRVDEDALTDDGTAFAGTVQWPWLDFGQAGVTKQLEAFDYVGTGQGPSIAIGYDQRSTSTFTASYQLASDTLPGTPIPFPIAAPTLSVKLSFAGGAAWSVKEVLLLLDDAKGQP